MRYKNIIAALLLSAVLPLSAAAQDEAPAVKKERKAWEIGLGGSLINWTRISVNEFQATDEGYKYSIDEKHLLGGANLYLARELNRWLYLDLQGTAGLTHTLQPDGSKKRDMLYMGGLGLQFRFTPLISHQWIEPYLRAGINYLHKDFDTAYSGGFDGDQTGQGQWTMKDLWNSGSPDGNQRNVIPASVGAGFHFWLSNRVGFGLQGDYFIPLQGNHSRFFQGTARLLIRLGGRSKAQKPVVTYVDRPVEKIVERVVEKEVPVEKASFIRVSQLLDNILFEHDKDIISPVSSDALDELAEILKGFAGERFIITGYTDATGYAAYNKDLSERRARAVYEALMARGLDKENFKYFGAGMSAAVLPASASEEAREGDRKVVIERVKNEVYWNAIK